MENVAPFEITQEYFDRLKEALENKDAAYITESLSAVKHEDISTLLESFSSEDSKYIVGLLDDETAADIIGDLEEIFREKFLAVFAPEEIAVYIELIETDDAADILNELPVKIREEVIANIQNEEKAKFIIELLRYEEDCAGGLMAKELIKANLNWNVVQCIEEIRRQAENVEKIFSVYVVDDDDKFLGRVSLKKIILSNARNHIADIYERIPSQYTHISGMMKWLISCRNTILKLSLS